MTAVDDTTAAGDLATLLTALGPARDHVVVVGGWAPWAYRDFPWANPGAGPAPRTLDFDVAVGDIPAMEPPLLQRLDEGGYTRLTFCGSDPAVTKFQPSRFGGSELAPIHAEFLTPLTGRDRAASTKEIAPGVTAQALRYMDIALEEPIAWCPERISGHQGLTVPLVHPANFVVQKLLILDKRKDDAKRAKDLAYLYDVAQVTVSIWGEMAERVGVLAERLPAKWMRRAKAVLRDAFLAERAAGPALVAGFYGSLPGAHSPTAEDVTRVMSAFADALGLSI